jgi:hypothetical protein
MIEELEFPLRNLIGMDLVGLGMSTLRCFKQQSGLEFSTEFSPALFHNDSTSN